MKPPTMPTRVWNYAIELAKHKLNGSPKLSKAAVLARHDICKPCSFYTLEWGNPICIVCGCDINTDTTGTKRNKLHWADSECPKGEWGREDKPVSTGKSEQD